MERYRAGQGSHDAQRTVHALTTGFTGKKLGSSNMERYRAGQGSHDGQRTVHALTTGFTGEKSSDRRFRDDTERNQG